MDWKLDVCGDEALFMPKNEKCDECEEFLLRLNATDDLVQQIIQQIVNTYTKEEVDALIGDIEHIRMKVVTELPQTGESNVIYLLEDPPDSGTYDMYVYTEEDGWVPIGSTDLDLTDYVTKAEFNASHTQFLHTFTMADWVLQSGGVWDGWYANEKIGCTVHNPAGHVRASGTTLASPASSSVKAAVSRMEFEIDDTEGTLIAYSLVAPSEDISVSVQGVE